MPRERAGLVYGVLGSLLRRLEPETAHRLTIRALSLGAAAGLAPAPRRRMDDRALAVRLWGQTFSNPLGLAAGFDKNAEVPDVMLAQGFGFVEVGTVTRRAQLGNPRPRVFRLAGDRALINRLGFNNDGLEKVTARLVLRRRRAQSFPGLLGVNIGPNRDSLDPVADCAFMVRSLAPLADYLVVNVSSPNTPGLRDLQANAALRSLLAAVTRARAEAGTGTGTGAGTGAGAGAGTPILLKISPDLSEDDLPAVAQAALDAKIDGMIATNTTVERPTTLRGPRRTEGGGLSGAPLFVRSTAVLADLYRLTEGKVPLIGVGGVSSGADAYAKIRAGASLVQLYTALVYQGPRLIGRIKEDIVHRLRADGFSSVAEAVGSGARQ